MKTYCPKCGMPYEVGESHRNSHMCCLGCDSFFKVESKIETSGTNLELAEFEADPPKMNEISIASELNSLALIDDFLDPDVDFENEPEDEPVEYIDFLSVGLDISSSDLIENHVQNQADIHSPQKEQE